MAIGEIMRGDNFWSFQERKCRSGRIATIAKIEYFGKANERRP